MLMYLSTILKINYVPGWKSKCKVSMYSIGAANLSNLSNYYSMSLTNLDFYIYVPVYNFNNTWR